MPENQLDRMEQRLERAEGRLNVLTDHVAVLTTDVAVLKTDVAVLKTDVAVLKTDVAVLTTDVAVLKTDVAVIKADVGVLKTDVHNLSLRFESHRDELRMVAEGQVALGELVRAEFARERQERQADRDLLAQVVTTHSAQIAQIERRLDRTQPRQRGK